jgi:hypothetical protein
MNPTFKAPGTKRLKLKYEKVISILLKSCFNLSLRRYIVASEWACLEAAPRWVFIEDEGPHVGKCSVDPGLFQRMRHAPLVVNVVAPQQARPARCPSTCHRHAI